MNFVRCLYYREFNSEHFIQRFADKNGCSHTYPSPSRWRLRKASTLGLTWAAKAVKTRPRFFFKVITGEDNAHLLRLQKYCECGICSFRPNAQPTILLGSFEEIEGEHQEEKGRTLVHRGSIFPPRQCTCPHRALCEAVFDRKWHDTKCSPLLLSRLLIKKCIDELMKKTADVQLSHKNSIFQEKLH